MKRSPRRPRRTTASIASVLFGLTCLATPAWAQQLVRPPYLQQSTPSSVIVVWRTDVTSEGRVSYGLPGQAMTTVDDSQTAAQHEVKISGLQPDTLYRYSVGTKSTVLAGGDAQHTFRTAPTPGQERPFRFWVVGDSGTGGTSQAQVRDAMLAASATYLPDLYLHMGDMAYGSGTDAQFTSNFFAVYKDILRNTVCWPTLGNHEGISSQSGPQTGPYYEAYVLPKAAEAGGVASGTEAYYSFDHANVHFIVLDSHDSSRSPTGPMLTWLKTDLAATKQPWLIAYWHHPPYTKGSHNSDTEGQLIDMRENALPILEAAGVDLVLAGHSHIYERSFLVRGAYDTPTTAGGKIKDSGDGKLLGKGAYRKASGDLQGGAVYVVAGHGGASLGQVGTHPLMYFTEKMFGSCVVDVDRNILTLVNVRADGQLSDRFTLVKGDALVLASPDGGESYGPGEVAPIRWATAGAAVAQVTLELSTDDGKTWTKIAGPIANSGSYNWTAPAISTTKARVRVSAVGNAARYDVSNAPFTLGVVAPKEVILFGDTWKYDDSATDHGLAFTTAGFDDSGWKSGKGQLGYGDGDETTTLLDADPNTPSAYFRKTITLSAPVTQADLKVLFDDGFAIWINGTQVFQRNMGNGTNFSAWASAQSSDNEIATQSLDLSANNPFVVGDNVIAALVKQVSGTSSDLSFDLSLTLTTAPPPAPDAGPSADASMVDGAVTHDAASKTDAPKQRDGGATDGGKSSGGDGGCSCRVDGSNAASPFAPLLLLGLLLAVRASGGRRRTARSHRPPSDRW